MVRSIVALLVAVVAPACAYDRLADTDEIYFDWGGQRVLCAAGLDEVSGNDLANIRGGLARAAERGEVIDFFTHTPGKTISRAKLEAVLGAADDLGLEFVTFEDLAAGGPPRGGIAIGFDDNAVDAWWGVRDLLAAHAARVTFFVTRFDLLSAGAIDHLHQLAARGHAIEAHGLRHRIAPDYVAAYGLEAYLDDEVRPCLALLRAAGFEPHAFAYPFGARTDEIDRAVLREVDLVRSVSFTVPYPLVSDPCPE